jgi:hypothetical protein
MNTHAFINRHRLQLVGLGITMLIVSVLAVIGFATQNRLFFMIAVCFIGLKLGDLIGRGGAAPKADIAH